MLQRRLTTAIGGAALTLVLVAAPAFAQFNFPGVPITVPPPAAPATQGQPAPSATAPQQPQRAAPPPKAAKSAPPKPEPPKTAPSKQAAAKAPAKPKSKAVTTASADPATIKAGQSIIMLVNDEPITAYELEMRTRFLAVSQGGQTIQQSAQDSFKRLITSEATNARFRAIVEQIIQKNQATKSREQIMAMIEAKKKEFAMSLQKQAVDGARSAAMPRFRKEAQEELIDEKLKLQEARRLGVLASDQDIDRVIKGIAERNKQTPAQFAQNLRNMGSDISVMRARFQAAFSWRDVIRRKYAGQISVNQRDVDRMLQQSAKPGDETLELQVQKITLPLPGRLDQGAMAARLADADTLRRKFAGCKSTRQIAASVPGAKFEDVKFIKPSTVTEPTRSFLANAKDGEMLPPQTATAGIEIYTVCGRRELKVDETKREEAKQQLQSRELEQLAKRHLRDLRQDAHIEMR